MNKITLFNSLIISTMRMLMGGGVKFNLFA